MLELFDVMYGDVAKQLPVKARAVLRRSSSQHVVIAARRIVKGDYEAGEFVSAMAIAVAFAEESGMRAVALRDAAYIVDGAKRARRS